MKKIAGFDHDFGGGDVKGQAGAELGIEGSDIVADVHVKAKFPIEKALNPAMKVVDNLIDKVEQWIPGDQKALAGKFKAEAREELVKLLSEQVQAPPAPVEP